MKKNLLKSIYLTVFAALLSCTFSSCLGDSESSREFPNDFVYITVGNDYVTKYGINYTGWCRITYDGINNLRQGDCVRMSYKINSNNISNSLYNAENVTLHKVYTKSDGSQIDLYIGKNWSTPVDIEVPGTFHVNFATADQTLGDRWLFSFKRTDNTGSIEKKYVPRFYYDSSESAQTETDANNQSTPVGVNRAIIDVRFYEGEGGANPSGVGITSGDFVCDFSNFRNTYKPDFTNAQESQGKLYIPVVFKFRYKDADGKLKYIGNWQNTGYVMYFSKNK